MVSDALTDRLLGFGPTVCGEPPMRIVCPNCATSYRLDPSTLGSTGRSVRCVRCRTVWFADGSQSLAVAAAESAQPVAAGPDPSAALPDWPEDMAEIEGPDAAPDPAQEPSAIVLPTTEAELSPMPVVDSPALAPGEATASEEVSAPEDIESVAARRALEQARKRRFNLLVPGLPTTILALILINLGLVGWRTEIVRLLPQTASLFSAIGLPVNLRGLTITDVTTEIQTHEGVPVLLVEGRIISAARRTVEVPRLRFAVRNEAGNEIYSWTALPNRSLLGPGESLPFQSRLASPPADTRDVLVRFYNRRDINGGE